MEKLKIWASFPDNPADENIIHTEKINEIIDWINRQNPVKSDDSR